MLIPLFEPQKLYWWLQVFNIEILLDGIGDFCFITTCQLVCAEFYFVIEGVR